jgi:hypothetical protein
MKYYENFLDSQLLNELERELSSITDWKDFDRNTSHMKETYNENAKVFNELRSILHSKNFIQWVEEESSVNGLIVDSFGIGEGISLMEKGDKLNSHIDFNWNDRIKMYRSVNLLIYFGDCQGGEFHIWDDNREKIIFEKSPKNNSAILFKHSETKSHGVNSVLSGKRYAIRQFYYKSELTVDNPHQSLYWFNVNKNMKTNSKGDYENK